MPEERPKSHIDPDEIISFIKEQPQSRATESEVVAYIQVQLGAGGAEGEFRRIKEELFERGLIVMQGSRCSREDCSTVLVLTNKGLAVAAKV